MVDTRDNASVQTILGQVAADEDRIGQICADIAGAHRRVRNSLVFTDRTGYLGALRAELCTRHGLEPAVLTGRTGKETHTAVLHGLWASGAPIVLLATGAYLA